MYGDGAWHDARSEKGRRYAAAPEPLCNVEAEQALLGCIIYAPETVFEVDGALRAEHFFEPFHQRLYDLLRQQAQQGRKTDPALLQSRFAGDDAFKELGGVRYLADLMDRAPPPTSAPDYAREVAAMFTRRELVRLGSEIRDIGRASEKGDADELLAEAERLVSAATARSGAGEQFTQAGVVVRNAIDSARARSGRVEFSFGVRSLDEHIGGLNAGEVTILAARPGMGKTVGAQTVARANASAGLGTCLFSLEMGQNALGLRMATDVAFDRHAPLYSGQTTNPTADKANKHLLDAGQWQRLEEAQAEVATWPLLIDSRAGLTLAQIESAARRAHRRWERKGIKPGPVIIDHLGKVRPSLSRNGNKHAEMADISNGTAEMAKRLGVPVVALVQLNRGVEGRDDKTPVLSDLRQAGELEEDARQVIFLYRPEYYLREPTKAETFADKTERLEKLQAVERQMFWGVEKNSHGPRGQVLTFCDIACSAIRDWEVCR